MTGPEGPAPYPPISPVSVHAPLYPARRPARLRCPRAGPRAHRRHPGHLPDLYRSARHPQPARRARGGRRRRARLWRPHGRRRAGPRLRPGHGDAAGPRAQRRRQPPASLCRRARRGRPRGLCPLPRQPFRCPRDRRARRNPRRAGAGGPRRRRRRRPRGACVWGWGRARGVLRERRRGRRAALCLPRRRRRPVGRRARLSRAGRRGRRRRCGPRERAARVSERPSLLLRERRHGAERSLCRGREPLCRRLVPHDHLRPRLLGRRRRRRPRRRVWQRRVRRQKRAQRPALRERRRGGRAELRARGRAALWRPRRELVCGRGHGGAGSGGPRRRRRRGPRGGARRGAVSAQHLLPKPARAGRRRPRRLCPRRRAPESHPLYGPHACARRVRPCLQRG